MSSSTDAVASQPTGEIDEMGMPVIETPGDRTGVAVAGPVEVTGASGDFTNP